LKVYPTPSDLISIYDKTVPKVCCLPDQYHDFADIHEQPVLDILAEMIAADSSLHVRSFGGGPGSDSGIPGVGLD
jgi:mitochondrial import receptor subunit TOM20